MSDKPFPRFFIESEYPNDRDLLQRFDSDGCGTFAFPPEMKTYISLRRALVLVKEGRMIEVSSDQASEILKGRKG